MNLMKYIIYTLHNSGTEKMMFLMNIVYAKSDLVLGYRYEVLSWFILTVLPHLTTGAPQTIGSPLVASSREIQQYYPKGVY